MRLRMRIQEYEGLTLENTVKDKYKQKLDSLIRCRRNLQNVAETDRLLGPANIEPCGPYGFPHRDWCKSLVLPDLLWQRVIKIKGRKLPEMTVRKTISLHLKF